MKKRRRIFFIVLIVSLLFTSVAYADFSGNSVDYTFSRSDAVDYMIDYYTYPYNNDYIDFTNYGGDCTNYASQVMHAGGISFTSTSNNPTYEHWYYDGWDSTPSWILADQFRKHFGDINGTGEKRAKGMTTYTVSNALANFTSIWLFNMPGDVISHGHNLSSSYHSQIIYDYTLSIPYDLQVSQHSSNYLNRSLKDYLQYRVNIGEGNQYIFIIDIW